MCKGLQVLAASAIRAVGVDAFSFLLLVHTCAAYYSV